MNRKGIVLLIGVVVTIGIGLRMAQAQPHIPRQAVQSEQLAEDILFPEILSQVARRYQVAVVAEGTPLTSGLKPSEFNELQTRLKEIDLPVQNALETVAEKFDYTVSRGRLGVFLLKKRYSHVNDLVCVTPEEWQAAIKEVVALVAPLSPNVQSISRDQRTFGFIKSLSPEQLAAMKGQGLAYSQMTPEQQNYLWILARYYAIQKLYEDLVRRQAQAEAANNPETQIGWFPLNKEKVFAYGLPADTRNRTLLSGTDYSQFALSEGTLLEILVGPVGGPRATGLQMGAREKEQPGIRLDAFLQKLNIQSSRNPDRTGKKSEFRVDRTLAAKRITIAGEEYASLVNQFWAVAEVFGLRVEALTAKDGTESRTLTRRSGGKPARDLAEMYRKIWEALPEPYLRAIGKFEKPDAEMLEKLRERYRGSPGSIHRTEENWRLQSALFLKEVIEPQLKNERKERIAREALNETAQRAVANLCMAAATNSVGQLLAHFGVDARLDRFQTTVITGGMEKDEAGKPAFIIALSYQRDDGSLMRWAGSTMFLPADF